MSKIREVIASLEQWLAHPGSLDVREAERWLALLKSAEAEIVNRPRRPHPNEVRQQA